MMDFVLCNNYDKDDFSRERKEACVKFQQLNNYPKIKNFVAIDFETAEGMNPCQIGMAIVRDGVIVKTLSRFIRPPYNKYNPITISIHHISPEKTISQPEFPEIWNEIKCFFDGEIIVAHNARYDMNVLSNALSQYKLPFPDIKGYICTCDLNNRENLELACARYGIRLQNHHDGEDDAVNCAKLFLAYVNDESKLCDDELPQELFVKQSFNPFAFEGHDVLKGNLLKKDLSGANPNNPFYNRKVVITGLFNIERIELANILKSMGADIDVGVCDRTNYLLIGDDPGPSKIKKFDFLIAEGKDVRKIYQEDLDLILSGDEYYALYHTELPPQKVKEVKVLERKTTWPQLVEKFNKFINGECVDFTDRDKQSEDYRLLSLYYKQQQKISTTKSTILENLRQLDEIDECEFQKDIISCFCEGENISKECAYNRLQNVYTKYGLNFKPKTCVLVELGFVFEEYKVKGIHHLLIKHLPNIEK